MSKIETIPGNFPPCPYVKLVAQHCPKALKTYIDLWEMRDPKNRIVIDKREIVELFSQRKAEFAYNISKLVAEGLVSMNQNNIKMTVELTEWHED